jgi:hypothetical protein
MIPTVFIPCRYIPIIMSTKLDQAKLRNLNANLNLSRIAEYSLVDLVKCPPETDMERHVQKLFASVFKVQPDTIGRDDSFIKFGSDLISAT